MAQVRTKVDEQLVISSTMQTISDSLEKGKQQYPGNSQLAVLEAEFQKLQEELSTADWGKLGTLAGLLWYRLDAVLASLRNIEMNTAKMASSPRH